MSQNLTDFKVGVIKPVECLKEGWALIKDDYWLFFGIVIVGIIIGGAVPIILIGPMMVGIYLCLFRKMRGEPVEFGGLFKGFDFFVQGLVAAAIQMVPLFVIMALAYVILFAVMMVGMPRGRNPDPSEASGFLITVFVLYFVFLLVVIVVALAIQIFFLFAYPLIADRNLSGLDAVKASMKAGKANFGGILGLLLVNAGLGILGVLCCYFGVFFILPVSIASYAVAYRRVFPEFPQTLASPPPPPANWA